MTDADYLLSMTDEYRTGCELCVTSVPLPTAFAMADDNAVDFVVSVGNVCRP